jgi:LytS/YehU family sensor histidine kinase
MEKSLIIGLVQNTAILLAFSMFYDYSWVKVGESKSALKKIFTGIVIGFMGIVLMTTPWKLVPGIIFDTRSILLSFAGLFFGFIPTLVAVTITGIYRLLSGGDGVWMGLAVIILSGGIGLLWNKLRIFLKFKNHVAEFLLLGYAVHIVMLACAFFLPNDQILKTIKTIFIPLVTIYPAGTALLGILMMKQNINWHNKISLNRFRESELRSSEMLINAKIKAEESDKLKSIFLANMERARLSADTDIPSRDVDTRRVAETRILPAGPGHRAY